MSVTDQLLECFDCARHLFADGWILMLDDGSVEVYCDYHRSKVSSFS